MNTTNERQSNFKTKFFNLVKSLLGACIALIVMRPSVIVCAAPTLSDLQIVDQSITRTGNATEKSIKVQGEYIGDGMEVELVSVKDPENRLSAASRGGSNSVNQPECSVYGVEPNTLYTYRARVSANTEGEKCFGSWSKKKLYCMLNPAVKARRKNVEISWPKIEGITKYAVQVSTRKRVNYKTIAYTKKSKRKIRVSDKMQYVKIVPIVNNKPLLEGAVPVRIR